MTVTVKLYDTTLRDGTQGEGVSLSCDDKLRIARRLDEFGMQYIEGGWPGSNPKDIEFFDRAQNELDLKQARLAAFGSTCRPNIDPADDQQVQLLIDANTPVVTIFGKSWDLHVTDVLRTDLEENLRMIRDTVAYLKSHGKEVIYDGEHFFDGFFANPEYALATMQAAIVGGADSIVLCDTNGGTLPWQVVEATEAVRREVLGLDGEHSVMPPASKVILGIHAHNDSETGVANTLDAVRAGCTHVQGTINGYGERCGNANLVSVIPDLQLKMGYDVVPADKLSQLSELSGFVSEMANLNPDDHQPFVGNSAFAHKGGMHVNAVEKFVMSYQHIDPALVGNETRVVVSELSGKDNIAVKRREFGLDGLTPRRRAQGAQSDQGAGERRLCLRERRSQRRSHVAPHARRLRAALRDDRLHRRRGASGRSRHVFRSDDQSEGRRRNPARGCRGQRARQCAQSARCARRFCKFYPRLDLVHLTDYKVRILDSRSGTAAITRVLIDFSDGMRNWATVGASTNIIEASWIALADSVEYFLLTDGERTR